MGLDMYLNARCFLRHGEDYFKKVVADQFPDIGMEVQEVIFEAMYWRKANAIHRWFVENVQGGQDDCKPYYVFEYQSSW